jgi:CheY-like chemotaxis protein
MTDTITTSLSILIADDEDGIRKLLVHWLERAGHTVTCVTGGHAAARLLRAQRFDLVITDIVMPEGDGYELIAEFRKVQPSTRILAISGGGKYLQSADCLRMARGLGAHAVVMKPFNWEQLQAGIEVARPTPHIA